MIGFRGFLISTADCRPERLREMISDGATALCLPILKTRTGLQSTADEANRLGLAVYGWIALPEGAGAHDLRRLVEAYPTLDGYFVRGMPAAGLEILSGYTLIPVGTADSGQIPPGFNRAAVPGFDALTAIPGSQVWETYVVLNGVNLTDAERELSLLRANSAGAFGVIFAMIPDFQET